MNACKDQRRGGAMTQQSLHGHPVNCPGRSQLRHGFFGWKGIAGEKSLLAHQGFVNPGASEGELRKMDVGVNKAGKQHLNSFSQLAFVAEYISPFFAPFMFLHLLVKLQANLKWTPNKSNKQTGFSRYPNINHGFLEITGSMKTQLHLGSRLLHTNAYDRWQNWVNV